MPTKCHRLHHTVNMSLINSVISIAHHIPCHSADMLKNLKIIYISKSKFYNFCIGVAMSEYHIGLFDNFQFVPG